MNSDQTASLIYLVLLAMMIGSYVMVASRRNIARGLRHAALWVLIFLGVIVAYGLWEDIRGTVIPRQSVLAEEGRIEVPMASDGHYYMTLGVNGVLVEFVVDTGATEIVLTRRDAARAGVEVDSLRFLGTANTANGPVRTAQVRLREVDLGGITDRNVTALVNSGEMDGSLLGMTYLNRFAEVSFGRGRMVLTR
ncbi:MAG: TIGR02281 family clan AA aspartic protease [Tropicimonas sp.]|uniref:retropepsin-like aspartic protease family protein n=1 Tax=Tropicimonas sp. TaxID=2067044 RepID=UPI003A8406EE